MEARKIAEAEAELASAAKCLKTSMFGRWKPDHEAAASHYEKAATAFRVGKAMPRAVEAYVKSSAEHEEFDSLFMAAKHLESAAVLERDSMKQPDRAVELFERASKLHQLDGRTDAAAEALSKAGRAMEPTDARRAAELMVGACGLFDGEEELPRLLGSIETYKQAVNLLLRGGQPAAAAPLLQKQAQVHVRVQQPHAVARCELSAVVIFLAADDYERASASSSAAQLRADGFSGSEEAIGASDLLEAYAQQSEEAVAEVIERQVFSFLENQVVHAARALRLTSVGVPVDRLASVRTEGAAVSGSAGVPVVEGSDLVLGLGEGGGDFGEAAPEDEARAEPQPPPRQQPEEELTDDLC